MVRMLRSLAGSCGVLIVGFLLAADWPQILGPTRNGISPETGLLQTWPKKGP